MSNEIKQTSPLFWSMVLLLGVVAAILLWPFIPALLWATVLAVLFHPLYTRFSAKFNRNASALLATLVAALVIVVPFAILGTIVGAQVYAMTNRLLAESPGHQSVTLDQIAREADAMVGPIMKQVGLSDLKVSTWIEQNRDNLPAQVLGPLRTGLEKLITTIVTLVVALLTMFFMLRDGPRLLEPVVQFLPLKRDRTLAVLERTRQAVHAVFVGIVLVSGVQALIAGLTYWLVGIEVPLVWTGVTFALCVIPLLGAPVVYVPLGLKLILDGKVTQGLILLGVGFFIVSQIDNILRPFFIGARIGIHPMLIFFSVLGGVLALGPVGVMAGPMLLIVMLGVTDVVREMNGYEVAIAAPSD